MLKQVSIKALTLEELNGSDICYQFSSLLLISLLFIYKVQTGQSPRLNLNVSFKKSNIFLRDFLASIQLKMNHYIRKKYF